MNGPPARATRRWSMTGARAGWAAQVAALRRVARVRPVILGYHGVADCPRRDDLFLLQLPPRKFRTQLELMLAAGFTFVTVAELARRLGRTETPAGLAAVSFDDGMRNNLTNALPILAELGIVATVYVPTAWVGARSPWIGPGGDGAILAQAELTELAEAGWEIGAHTRHHADLSKLDYGGCRSEIDGCLADLAELGHAGVRTLAYPFGHYGPAAVDAVRDAGLEAAVTTGSGSWARFELTRAMIGAADPLAVMLLKMTDRYEPLLSSGPLRHARTLSKQARHLVSARRNAPGGT